MATYSASLRAVGDPTPVPATVELDDGQLSIAAGAHEIGTWQLSEIDLEPVSNGYRMAAEGDEIIIELQELDAFREALANGRFKRRIKIRGRERKTADTAEASEPSTRSTTDAKPKKSRAREQENRKQKKQRSTDGGFVERGFEMLDNLVEASRRRFGPYLPNWLFSRGMFMILFAIFLLSLFYPMILIILGAVVVAVGAAAYSDPVMASKLLPGRTQPPHALIGGVGILLLGVIVGIIFG